MTGICFKRIAPDESRIYDAAGDHVGDVFALDDPLPRAPGISSYTSTKTRAALAASMSAAASVRKPLPRRYPSAWGTNVGQGFRSPRQSVSKFGRCLRPGLSVPISGRRSLRFPLRSLSRNCGTVCASIRRTCQAQPPKGAVPGTNKYSSDVMDHCATRAHCANPAAGGVLHSAALRCGRDSE